MKGIIIKRKKVDELKKMVDVKDVVVKVEI